MSRSHELSVIQTLRTQTVKRADYYTCVICVTVCECASGMFLQFYVIIFAALFIVPYYNVRLVSGQAGITAVQYVLGEHDIRAMVCTIVSED